MRLAIVSQPADVVPGGGSVAIWTQELTRRLAEHHEICVFSRQHAGQADRETIEGIEYRRLPTPLEDRGIALLRGLSRRVGEFDELFYRYYFGAHYYRGYAGRVAKQIAGGPCDAILVMNFPQFLPVLRRRNPSARIALMMHCDWLVELDRKAVARWLESADAICGCSEHVAGGAAKRFPEYASRCHAVLNGSNPERFAESDETRARAETLRTKLGLERKKVILFVGRVCPEKGVHVLVEAMGRVREQCEDAVLLVVGSHSQQPPSPLWVQHRDERFARDEALKPGYRGHLEEIAEGLGDQVRMLGKVPYEDLPDYYAVADVFVHPAVWQEPFGMTLTEAMGCRLPVVSTRAGGIPEIVVDGETGLLARPGDLESLADAILELLADPTRRREMGRRGRERLHEHLTWAHTARRLEAALEPDPSSASASTR